MDENFAQNYYAVLRIIEVFIEESFSTHTLDYASS